MDEPHITSNGSYFPAARQLSQKTTTKQQQPEAFFCFLFFFFPRDLRLASCLKKNENLQQ